MIPNKQAQIVSLALPVYKHSYKHSYKMCSYFSNIRINTQRPVFFENNSYFDIIINGTICTLFTNNAFIDVCYSQYAISQQDC